MSAIATAPLVTTGSCPSVLVDAVRREVRRGSGWSHTAQLVAAALRAHLPRPEQLLSAEQLAGDPDGYRTHLVHAEPDGSFSVAAMVWRPGQQTPVHDHVTWCVTGVIQGMEYEEIFDAALNPVAKRQNPPGTVCGFAPPGDIHRVRNCGTGVAVSMHIYGADLTCLGSSIRREYALS
jgi:predicted metal-dependent enzyme (double-stranded beta helix superfamily)